MPLDRDKDTFVGIQQVLIFVIRDIKWSVSSVTKFEPVRFRGSVSIFLRVYERGAGSLGKGAGRKSLIE